MFDSDPEERRRKLYETLTSKPSRRLGLGVMDQTAITLCEENDIPVVVFNIGRDGNIVDALRGRNVGTRRELGRALRRAEARETRRGRRARSFALFFKRGFARRTRDFLAHRILAKHRETRMTLTRLYV